MPGRILFLSGLILAAVLLTQVGEEPRNEVLSNRRIEASSISAHSSLNTSSDLITTIPEPPPELNLQSALVKDLSTNFYFLKLNTNKHWPLASLTKLLTAVVALEEMGDIPKVYQLVRMMMIVSSNEAAEELSELYGKEQFISVMRKKAAQLGMDQTSIFDVTGLSFLNQSTVRDLEKLISYIIKDHPQILQFSRETEIVINGKKTPNINQFASRPAFMGGKTGYTDEASGNLLSIFQYEGRPILIIVLGTADRFSRFEQTQILFEWISRFYK